MIVGFLHMEEFPIHRLGWKAFQDLCVGVVEEQTKRTVQTFLPSNDAGRDGAFVGRWDGHSQGNSTIQCKFTSKANLNLTLSMLIDEIPKAKRLAKQKLADDYIILTNHTITGSSELKIRKAFESVGVKRCRVFHRDWM
ncbi:restriction endonuclease [Bradyrhizobium sp. LA2.1]|uniref:restriction endonuclease n=1 Tax=Bradyrhizobium sp. LA2.1 TaxID=3156376 RepID=UPI003398B6A1